MTLGSFVIRATSLISKLNSSLIKLINDISVFSFNSHSKKLLLPSSRIFKMNSSSPPSSLLNKVFSNNYLSQCRVVVENTFGRLKGRFRCLTKMLETNVEHTVLIISACCVLHNFCELHKQNIDATISEDDLQVFNGDTLTSGENVGDVAVRDIKNYLFNKYV